MCAVRSASVHGGSLVRCCTSFYDGKRGTNTMTGLRAIRYNIVLFEGNYCVLKIFDGNRPIVYVTRERTRVITAKYQSVLSAAVRLTKRRAARRLLQRSYNSIAIMGQRRVRARCLHCPASGRHRSHRGRPVNLSLLSFTLSRR